MVAADLLARARAWMQRTVVGQPPSSAEPGALVVVPSAPGLESPPADNTQLAIRIAAALCRRFEGLFLQPYLCPAGVPSIGYGTTRYEDGRAVTLLDPPISKERAEHLLMLQIRDVYLPAVQRLCPEIDTPERLGAIIDWCYNLGAGNLKNSTMRRRINAGRWSDVPAEIRKWVLAGGRRMRGLVSRRDAEAELV